jgi:hypothetical protein
MALQIMFIYVDTAEENLAKPFLTLYGLESEKGPTVSFTLDSQLILHVPFAVTARVHTCSLHLLPSVPLI